MYVLQIHLVWVYVIKDGSQSQWQEVISTECILPGKHWKQSLLCKHTLKAYISLTVWVKNWTPETTTIQASTDSELVAGHKLIHCISTGNFFRHQFYFWYYLQSLFMSKYAHTYFLPIYLIQRKKSRLRSTLILKKDASHTFYAQRNAHIEGKKD